MVGRGGTLDPDLSRRDREASKPNPSPERQRVHLVLQTQVAAPTIHTALRWHVEVGVATAEEEFEQFFLSNYDAVLRVIVFVTGDRERATDATQEAFIKAYAKWSKIRSYDSPAGWVRRIAINASRDSFRSERRRHRREQTLQPVAPTSQTDQFVAESFARDLLQALPRRQREIATFFYVDDRSVNEIAEILRLNEGTVKFHLSQARDRLRQQLAQDEAPR
jgi:RNA polymerase sigma-70 factor (ECF subfamily)